VDVQVRRCGADVFEHNPVRGTRCMCAGIGDRGGSWVETLSYQTVVAETVAL
jgi:hypothetical protein